MQEMTVVPEGETTILDKGSLNGGVRRCQVGPIVQDMTLTATSVTENNSVRMWLLSEVQLSVRSTNDSKFSTEYK